MLNQRKIYIPPSGPPSGPKLDPEIYQMMGEAQIFAMIEEFYFLLKQSAIGSMFPEDYVTASKKTGAFFVFLFGGPPLYHERHGNPMMRARHLPFVIDEAARQEWMRCFCEVLKSAPAKYQFPEKHEAAVIQFLESFSAWMVNSGPVS